MPAICGVGYYLSTKKYVAQSVELKAAVKKPASGATCRLLVEFQLRNQDKTSPDMPTLLQQRRRIKQEELGSNKIWPCLGHGEARGLIDPT